MRRLKRLPVPYVALGLAAIVSGALSLLVLSGVFEPRTTVTGSIFFDACNAGTADPACMRRSHWASGVAIQYQAKGPLPLTFTAHTNSSGEYRLELPPGQYRVKIQGCRSWLFSSTASPEVVVSKVPDDSGYNWGINANGTCEMGAIAL